MLVVMGSPVAARAGSDGQDFSLIQRGRYLTAVADCAACHNGVDKNEAFAGGRPIETPFGILIAPNITPDRETGIGAWSDDEFDAAVRGGRRRDGAHLYPAMPYPYYTKMSRSDVLAIKAYLDTLKPVRNQVVTNQLPFPLNIRTAMLAWNALYFTKGEFRPDRTKSAEWNRGAYLVEGPAHCGACHTSKTFLGGDKNKLALQGSIVQGWFAPDITSGPGALSDWTVDDIATYLRTGHNRFAAASGPMAEEIALSSSRMTNTDLTAIATYLKSVSGQKPKGNPAPKVAVMNAGKAIYGDLCAACHRRDGHGVANLFPDLPHVASVAGQDPTTVLRVILEGTQTVATDKEPTAPAMPAFGWQLNDDQVAAVASYVRNTWGHQAPLVTADEVKSIRANLARRTN